MKFSSAEQKNFFLNFCRYRFLYNKVKSATPLFIYLVFDEVKIKMMKICKYVNTIVLDSDGTKSNMVNRRYEIIRSKISTEDLFYHLTFSGFEQAKEWDRSSIDVVDHIISKLPLFPLK